MTDAVMSQHHVPGLSLTKEQIADRRNRLGASEMPVVAGLSKYKSPLALWAEKRGLIAEPFEGNEYTEWGTRLEGVVADAYAEKFNVGVARVVTFVAADGWRSATPDRKVFDQASYDPSTMPFGELPWLRGLEVKCRGDYSASDFGEAGTDQIPDEVAIQCHSTMSVLRTLTTPIIVDRWDVATLIGGNKFRSFVVYYDKQLDADLTELAHNFWHKYVVPGIEPPVDRHAATTEYLKQKFKQNSEVLLEATEEQEAMLARLRDIRQTQKLFEEEETLIKNQFMNWIGDAAGIRGHVGRVTWKAPTGNSVRWKEVAEELGAPAEVIARHSTPLARRFVPFYPKAK